MESFRAAIARKSRRRLIDRLATGSIEVFPTFSFFYNSFKVLAPDNFVVYGILDYGPDYAGGNIRGSYLTVSEVDRQSDAAVDYGYRFGCTQCPGR